MGRWLKFPNSLVNSKPSIHSHQTCMLVLGKCSAYLDIHWYSTLLTGKMALGMICHCALPVAPLSDYGADCLLHMWHCMVSTAPNHPKHSPLKQELVLCSGRMDDLKCLEYEARPGQGSSLWQCSFSSDDTVVQGRPPFSAFTSVLTRWRVPIPHVLVHSSHVPQAVQTQLTETQVVLYFSCRYVVVEGHGINIYFLSYS